MKRSTYCGFLAFVIAVSIASPSKACCLPYIPWLDPFAWLGFYGCGCGYGYSGGCGYGGGYGYGMNYAAPAYNYAPVAPMMNYSVPQSGCNCTSYAQPQAQMAAVQVPVTTYRPVTQYVPQTTYQNQYQYQQAATMQPQMAYNPAMMAPTTAYSPQAYPSTVYAPGSYTPVQQYSSGTTTYDNSYFPAPTYPSPMMTQPSMNVASPVQGEIHGVQPYPSQSATAPPVMMNSYQSGAVPVRSASYGVTPRPARSYSSIVR